MDKRIRETIYSMKDDLMLFHFLSDDELEEVIPYLEIVDYKKGYIMFKEGEEGDFIAFIVKGKMDVKKETEFKGKQIVLATLSKGSIVGEVSFAVPEEKRTATVEAREDTEVVILRRGSFERLMEKNPWIGIKIQKALLRILAIRLKKIVERLSFIF